MLTMHGLFNVDIEVDGGIWVDNIHDVVAAGATVLVIGSAIFNSKASVAANINELRQAIE